MKCQILRHQNYSRNSIGNIGRENHRTATSEYTHKNKNIDGCRTHLNINIMPEKTLYKSWEKTIEKMGIKKPNHKTGNLSQLMITASPEFFKNLGWDKEKAREWESLEECPREILNYFNDSLEFCKKWIGEGLVAVSVHFDEENPNMHVSYAPIHEGVKRKNVWARDSEGKLIKNEKGEKVRARDKSGHIIYEYVQSEKSISADSFMRARGGANSYRNLQDRFFEEVAKNYGLERGEIGSKAKHRNHHEYSKIIEENALIINEKKQEKRLLEAEVEVLSEKVKATQEVLENLELEPYIQALKELGRTYQTMEKQIKEIEHYQKTLKSIKTYAITHEIKPLPPYIDKALQHDPNKQIDREQSR